MSAIPHAISSLISMAQSDSAESKEALKKLQNHKNPKAVKLALISKDLKFNKDGNLVSKANHGGARVGSGRKAERGETVVKRFPERYLTAVNALIEHLDYTRGESGIVGYASEIKCRNLNDILITLRFQSNSTKTEM